MSSPAAARRPTPERRENTAAHMKELKPLRFINTTTLWSAATSPKQPAADQHGARREGQALTAQELTLVPEGVPPRAMTTEACLESLVSDPATPPEAPAWTTCC